MFLLAEKGSPMLAWKKLLEDTRRLGISRKPDSALAWIRRYLPELSVWYYKDDCEAGLDHDFFKWELEWPKWQKHLQALQWLAKARALPSKPRTRAHRIPLWVQEVIDQVLERTRNALLSDWITEARICIRLSGKFRVSHRFSSLDEFWEAVFVSFFEPEELPWGCCDGCGKSLPVTPKLKRTSRARLCAACRVKKWREDHPDKAREMWRRSKQKPLAPG
jgi:hypothetical protein